MTAEGHADDAPASGEPAEPPVHDESGLELARSIARGLAGRTGPARRTFAKGGPEHRRRSSRAPGESSGAHPDERDPQTLDTTLGRFVREHGWSTELRVHGVFTRWESVVGAEVAQHVTPETYAEGRLVVRTDSTAWATQMKLLAAAVVRRLNEVLGDGTVEVIDVLGPHTPSWTRGRLRVKGRGPRDTYG
ncbi:MAG TPA: DciA family protein [Marmoricola sp.]|nr:DciA family protein [Marmoricola sp.]